MEGLIVKAISGFYYVETAQGLAECKAKGIFRKRNVSPLVGDRVIIEVDEDGIGVVSEVLPRKNEFLRPPLANLDQIFLVASTCQPEPNYLVIDKLLAIAEYKEIETKIVVTKQDIQQNPEFCRIYQQAGYTVLEADNTTSDGNKHLLPHFNGKITALTGNTGVGKSSLLNAMFPDLSLETGAISQKLGRGRHTTRHVELFCIDKESYIADTPGFSTVELNRYDMILKEYLSDCFREFRPFNDKCKFAGCSHTREQGCAVLEAVQNGTIAPSRHQSYSQLYEDAKRIKEWEFK